MRGSAAVASQSLRAPTEPNNENGEDSEREKVELRLEGIDDALLL